MAKDDYFVLAYRILSYLYACFKAGERPDMDCISADVLHIPVGYWFNIMRSLTEEGYIVGLVFPASIGSAVSVKVIDLRITQKGIEFLQENSMMKKAAAFLKTIKDNGGVMGRAEKACDYTEYYHSIIGSGPVSVVKDREEKKKILTIFMECQDKKHFEFTDRMAAHVAVSGC